MLRKLDLRNHIPPGAPAREQTATTGDEALQRFVEDELAWARDVDARQVAVAFEPGRVLLSGQVGSFAEKLAAEQAAERGLRGAPGFRRIDNRISVHPRLRALPEPNRLAAAIGGRNG